MARRPSPAQMRARRLFAARYGGKKRRASTGGRRIAQRTVKPVARRFARTRSTARRAFTRGRGRGNKTSKVIDGALGAAAARAGAMASPTYGPGAAMAAVGWYRGNDTLLTLGVMAAAGAAIDSAGVPGLGGLPAGGVL